jgi:hypothetical protein
MIAVNKNEFSESDLLFLVETGDPGLVAKIDTIKRDPVIIEGMMDHEAHRLFRRIMLMGEDSIMARITPRFLFEVLLRMARRDLVTQSYTVERMATQKIPVFDIPAVVRFLDNKRVLKYLGDMMSSFIRVESFSLPVRVRKGIWRRIRFSDMDIDSLQRFCQAADEEHRFTFYKRIADLCLFITGIFPEYPTMDFGHIFNNGVRQSHSGRFKRSVEDYEEEGRHFYKLAGEHKDAEVMNLIEVFQQLHEGFSLARKPLNYISEHYLHLIKQSLFPSLSSN